ncbi:MAG: hypothetical protein KIS96_03580 [Bauldia sp.]|nr:hypothetical protein [Bauldia sp.]
MPSTKRGRGRPAHKPTAATRRTVEQMVSCGETHDTIALALEVSDETLRLHYRRELDVGAAKRRRELLDLLWQSARKGNVSAQKKLEETTRLAAASAKFDQPPKGESQPQRPATLGKKELAQRAAETAGHGTDWGDDLQSAIVPGTDSVQ